MQRIRTSSGFISWIILIIIALLVLSFFGINVREVAEDETTQSNFAYVWNWVVRIWEDYLQVPFLWFWQNIVLFIWQDLFIPNLENLQSGDTFKDLTPVVPEVGN